jgi:AhpD family alkylhydroperoxidase
MTDSRIDYYNVLPEAVKAMLGLEMSISNAGLEKILVELVKLRVSQINGCAYCVNLHAKDALKAGESQSRLNLLIVWHESPVFTERERAALAWAEAVTLISETQAPDNLYRALLQYFTEKEVVALTMAIMSLSRNREYLLKFCYKPS